VIDLFLFPDAPLDLATESFYLSRKEMIEDRLAFVGDSKNYFVINKEQNSSELTQNNETSQSFMNSEIAKLLQITWTNYYGNFSR
jgi:hypothetical protein